MSKASSSPSRTSFPSSEARASTIFGKRLLSTFSLRENKVTSEPRFTARQRYPSNLISNVQFSPVGKDEIGLHCMGAMKAGSIRLRRVAEVVERSLRLWLTRA